MRPRRLARRPEAAVIPGELNGRHFSTSGEIEVDEGSQGIGFVVTIGGAGFNARWCFELEDAEESVKTVAAHIAESAATEIGPAAPRKRKIDVIVWTRGSGAEPEIPIETLWNRF